MIKYKFIAQYIVNREAIFVKLTKMVPPDRFCRGIIFVKTTSHFWAYTIVELVATGMISQLAVSGIYAVN